MQFLAISALFGAAAVVPGKASRVVGFIVIGAFEREGFVGEGGAAGRWLVEGGGMGGR